MNWLRVYYDQRLFNALLTRIFLETEEGRDLIKDEVFDFLACIQEATEPFKKDAQRKGITYEVIEHPGLPRYVYGDQRRVRQAVANMTANAVEHTSTGGVRIECYTVSLEGSKVRVEIVVEDTGAGMSKHSPLSSRHEHSKTSNYRGSMVNAMEHRLTLK